jgi:hypothetical protein
MNRAHPGRRHGAVVAELRVICGIVFTTVLLICGFSHQQIRVGYRAGRPGHRPGGLLRFRRRLHPTAVDQGEGGLSDPEVLMPTIRKAFDPASPTD